MFSINTFNFTITPWYCMDNVTDLDSVKSYLLISFFSDWDFLTVSLRTVPIPSRY